MSVQLWHFTWSEYVDSIQANGLRNGDLGWVYFVKPGDRTNEKGDTALAVILDVTEDKIRRFEGEMNRSPVSRIPADFVNGSRPAIRLATPDEYRFCPAPTNCGLDRLPAAMPTIRPSGPGGATGGGSGLRPLQRDEHLIRTGGRGELRRPRPVGPRRPAERQRLALQFVDPPERAGRRGVIAVGHVDGLRRLRRVQPEPHLQDLLPDRRRVLIPLDRERSPLDLGVLDRAAVEDQRRDLPGALQLLQVVARGIGGEQEACRHHDQGVRPDGEPRGRAGESLGTSIVPGQTSPCQGKRRLSRNAAMGGLAMWGSRINGTDPPKSLPAS